MGPFHHSTWSHRVCHHPQHHHPQHHRLSVSILKSQNPIKRDNECRSIDRKFVPQDSASLQLLTVSFSLFAITAAAVGGAKSGQPDQPSHFGMGARRDIIGSDTHTPARTRLAAFVVQWQSTMVAICGEREKERERMPAPTPSRHEH